MRTTPPRRRPDARTAGAGERDARSPSKGHTDASERHPDGAFHGERAYGARVAHAERRSATRSGRSSTWSEGHPHRSKVTHAE